MAKQNQQVDAEGNPINSANNYAHLKSVSDFLPATQAGDIVYKLEDVQNRPFVLMDATIEAGTFGSYAKLFLLDIATNEEKVATSGATLIMTQVSALVNNSAFPVRVVVRKIGKTWTLN